VALMVLAACILIVLVQGEALPQMHVCSHHAHTCRPVRFVAGADGFLVCRKYCEQEPDWQEAMLLLDQWNGAGWNLIRDLAAGTMSASDLVDNHFCRV